MAGPSNSRRLRGSTQAQSLSPLSYWATKLSTFRQRTRPIVPHAAVRPCAPLTASAICSKTGTPISPCCRRWSLSSRKMVSQRALRLRQWVCAFLPRCRGKNAHTHWRNRSARWDTIFLDESDHLLQHGEIGVPVFEESGDAVGGAQGRTAARGTIGRVRCREVDSFVAQHESCERLCACVDPRNRR